MGVGWQQHPLGQRQEEEPRTSETSSTLKMLSLRPWEYPSNSFLQCKESRGLSIQPLPTLQGGSGEMLSPAPTIPTTEQGPQSPFPPVRLAEGTGRRAGWGPCGCGLETETELGESMS